MLTCSILAALLFAGPRAESAGHARRPVLQNLAAIYRPGDRERIIEMRRAHRLARLRKSSLVAYAAKSKHVQSDDDTFRKQVPVRRSVVQTVALRIVDQKQRAKSNFGLDIDVTDKSDKTVKERVTTSPDGVATITVKSFPTCLRLTPADPNWKIRDPERASVRLKGDEGKLAMRLSRNLVAMNESALPAALWSYPLTQDSGSKQTPKGKKKSKRAAAKKALVVKAAKPKSTAQVAKPNKAPAKPKQPLEIIVRRRFEPEQIIVEPIKVTYKVKTKPNSDLFLGEDNVGRTDNNGEASFMVDEWEDGSQPPQIVYRDETADASFVGTATLPPPAESAETPVALPEPPLTAIRRVHIDGVEFKDLTLWAGDVRQVFGKPKEEEYREGLAKDGSKWWKYDHRGLWFKVRDIAGPDGKDRPAVERVRVVSPGGGGIGDLTVGSAKSDVVAAIGEGQPSDDPLPLSKRVYVESGMLVKYTPDDKVEYLEFRRPPDLLKSGVDLHNVSAKTKVYLAPIQGAWTVMPDANERVKGWLQSLPSLEFVDNPEQADLSLAIGLNPLEEKTAEVFGGAPFEYQCRASFSAQVSGVAVGSDGDGPKDVSSEGAARASFKGDVEKGAILLVALAIVLGLAIRDQRLKIAAELIVAAVGVAAIQKMPGIMARASERSRLFALHEATQGVATALQNYSTFQGRVSAIDLSTGIVTLNAGSRQGVSGGMEFVLQNGDYPLRKATLSGLKRDMLVARVTDVSPDAAQCKLFHITHDISDKLRERFKEEESPRDAAKLLEPTTGMPTAKLVLHLPPEEIDSSQL